MNRVASGIMGFDPFVRMFRMSDGSPIPILYKKSRIIVKYVVKELISKVSKKTHVL